MSGRRCGTPVAATLLAALFAVAGCGGNAPPEGGPPDADAAAPDTLVGTVRQVGSTPFTRTVVEGERALTVTGPPAAELARLVGARVRVVGAVVRGDAPGPSLRVDRYEILSIDGDEPRVGVLRHEPGVGYRLETDEGETRPLRAVPPRLGGMLGARVWVVLDDAGGVLRYGLLREP